ncbi:hypothetical protein ACFV1N_48000 [Streptosporangium canum]|uniref:hypothetical protein n=1 Tax=Streptosporangium canum TaxID=324952 RepID=UPI00367DCC46
MTAPHDAPGITGTVLFTSEYAMMGRSCFLTSGPHAIPEIQIPVLADYAAHCQNTGQKVTPATYRAYTAPRSDVAICREIEVADDTALAHLREPSEQYLYCITPTDYTSEDGPADLLHLTVSGVDPEFDWLEIAAYFSAAALYRSAARLLRSRADVRTWRLQHHWGALAPSISPLVIDLHRRADRLTALATLSPSSLRSTALTPSARARWHTSYSDLLAGFRRHGVPDPDIDRRDACAAHITVSLPGDRTITARCARTGTLPADPTTVRSWLIERTFQGTATEGSCLNLLDPSGLAKAFGGQVHLVTSAIVAAHKRQQAGQLRLCPQCRAEVWDNRLEGEPCPACLPSHQEHTLMVEDIAEHLASEHGINVAAAATTADSETVKRWAQGQGLPDTTGLQSMTARYLHARAPHSPPPS